MRQTMAVTKIWPVKDSLSRLIEYAENPEKTAFESLETVMAYAGDEDKVIYEKGEKCYLVTALNCRGNALESMIKVQICHKRLKKRKATRYVLFI